MTVWVLIIWFNLTGVGSERVYTTYEKCDMAGQRIKKPASWVCIQREQGD